MNPWRRIIIKIKATSYHISSLLILIVLLSACSSPSNWDRFGLKGEVRTYQERSYPAQHKFGKWEPEDTSPFQREVAKFNEQGQLEEFESFYKPDISIMIPTFEGGVIVKESYYDEEGELMYELRYISSSPSTLEYEIYEKSGRKTGGGKYFLKNNRIVKRKSWSYRGEEMVEGPFTIHIEYDQNNHMLSVKSFNREEDEKLEPDVLYEHLEYDSKGNWTKRLARHPGSAEIEPTITIREIEYY